VSVYVADASACKLIMVDELQNLLIGGDACLWKIVQSVENKLALAQHAERELPDDERMREHRSGIEQGREGIVPYAKMIDPNGGIDQNHVRPERLRGAGIRSGSLPPRRASRRALSRSINALRASRTRAGFSFKPVRAWALAMSSSSRARVVRTRITFPLSTDYGIF
jgi:hypothetical protein